MKVALPRSRPPRARRKGLTLTELVMVLLILASLAAMVVPLIGSVREQSNRALAASGAADVINNLETFRVARNRYPQRMDSLLADDGSATLAPYSRLAAGNDEAVSPWFVVEDLSSFAGAAYTTSLARAKITTVMDHDAAAPNPSDSGRILRALTAGDVSLAVVTNDLVLAAAGVPDFDNDGLVFEEIPDSDGDGNLDVKYIALGVGPQSEVVGETMASPPFHAGAEFADYARFIAIFAVYESGQVAELKTVIDSRRVDISSNVSAYRDAGQ